MLVFVKEVSLQIENSVKRTVISASLSCLIAGVLFMGVLWNVMCFYPDSGKHSFVSLIIFVFLLRN